MASPVGNGAALTVRRARPADPRRWRRTRIQLLSHATVSRSAHPARLTIAVRLAGR